MADRFKFLVVADASSEFAPALAFAANWAKAIGASLVILKVVDVSTDQSQWVSVGEEMRAEALEAAEALAERLGAEVWAESGVQPEIVIREGEIKAELRRLVDADRDIRMLVLGAGSGRDGPGPLVSLVAKGHNWGSRALPVVIVPGALTREDARELAAPPTSPAPSPSAPPAPLGDGI